MQALHSVHRTIATLRAEDPRIERHDRLEGEAVSMRAIVRHRYGPPDVLRLEEVPKPGATGDRVLVRVHAASVNASDRHLLRGEPFLVRLMFGGLLRPRCKVLGSDIAGRVEAVGENVKRFSPGDEVFGDLSGSGFGAFAEYASVPESALAPKPAGTTFEEAATVPQAAVAALQGLRDRGRIRPGGKVLVHGASGGVGTFAVQIAKAFGAEVTGVCRTRGLDTVRSLGADHVVDSARDDVTRTGKRYDLIVDTAAYRSTFDYRRVLEAGGRYVLVGGSTARIFQVILLGPWFSLTGPGRALFLVSKPNPADLLFLTRLIEAGEIAPVIDRRYTLSEVPEAIRHLEEGHPRGKIVIAV
jgi:NADPH:quinone reductase-like Zn-dependent oxidoreductase